MVVKFKQIIVFCDSQLTTLFFFFFLKKNCIKLCLFGLVCHEHTKTSATILALVCGFYILWNLIVPWLTDEFLDFLLPKDLLCIWASILENMDLNGINIAKLIWLRLSIKWSDLCLYSLPWMLVWYLI